MGKWRSYLKRVCGFLEMSARAHRHLPRWRQMERLIDAEGNVIRWEYDSRNRVIRDIDGLGAVCEYSYDAESNVIAKTRRDSLQLTWQYDDVITYAYDPLGRRIERDEDGQIYGYEGSSARGYNHTNGVPNGVVHDPVP